jgi:hypothetical protein
MTRRLAMSFPYRQQIMDVLGRDLTRGDSVSRERLEVAEDRLGISLPAAMADFYLHCGAAPELQEHDRLRDPEALSIEDSYLVFMEENQRVVDWGVRLTDTTAADPEVWQRVNGDRAEWYSEDVTFSVFIVKRLAFTRGASLADGGLEHGAG